MKRRMDIKIVGETLGEIMDPASPSYWTYINFVLCILSIPFIVHSFLAFFPSFFFFRIFHSSHSFLPPGSRHRSPSPSDGRGRSSRSPSASSRAKESSSSSSSKHHRRDKERKRGADDDARGEPSSSSSSSSRHKKSKKSERDKDGGHGRRDYDEDNLIKREVIE